MRILILLGQKLVLQILHIFPERGNVRAEDNLIVYRQGLEDGLARERVRGADVHLGHLAQEGHKREDQHRWGGGEVACY